MSISSSGMVPPEFEARTPEGGKISLASLKGNVVLLSFWATWCRECRLEMPAFERLHREFADDGLSVLGVNFREDPHTIQKYAKELNLTFPILSDSGGDIQASYGVIGLPTTFLIGRKGQTVAFAVGPREWDGVAARTIIQLLLAEPTTERRQ